MIKDHSKKIMDRQRTLAIPSLSQLQSLTHSLASWLQAGDLIALDGPLGAGKTAFCQALAKSLHSEDKVVSPSFNLIHRYESGRIPITHMDLYRLGPDKAYQLFEEIDDCLEQRRSIVVVEWASYAPSLEADTSLSIVIQPQADDIRHFTLHSRFKALPDALFKGDFAP